LEKPPQDFGGQKRALTRRRIFSPRGKINGKFPKPKREILNNEKAPLQKDLKVQGKK